MRPSVKFLTALLVGLGLALAPVLAAPAAHADSKVYTTYYIPKKLPKYNWKKQCDSCVLPLVKIQSDGETVGIFSLDGSAGVYCGFVLPRKRIHVVTEAGPEYDRSYRYTGSSKRPRLSGLYGVPKGWNKVTKTQLKKAMKKVYGKKQAKSFYKSAIQAKPYKSCKLPDGIGYY